MWIFGQGGPCSPWGQEIVWNHKGREYLRAECSHSLRLQTEKHLALYQSKHPLLSPCLSLSPILLIDGREENTQAHTQRHISPPSSGYGTPTDMKTLRLLLRRTWEAWHRMKGNPSYRKNTGNSQNARWPFRADWMGFSPWPSTQHTHTNLPPPLYAAFLPSGNFSLGAELTVWCRSFYICLPVYIHPPSSLLFLFLLLHLLLLLFCPPYHFSLAQWNNRYVEKRYGIMYHCGICDIDYGQFMFTVLFFCTVQIKKGLWD